MNKQEFLDALRACLEGLPREDIEASLEFYGEAIDDRMESGLTEQEAVAEIGSVEEVAVQILSEMPLPKLIKARAKGSPSGWQIALIVLGSPVWLPLLLAAAICLLAAYLVVWSVVISFYALDAALAMGAIGGLAGTVQSLTQGNFSGAGMAFGIGMISAGLSVLLFLGMGRVSKLGVLFHRAVLRRCKNRLTGKGK